MVSCMGPVYDDGSTILILGSLPSNKSIINQEYYYNSQNQFWKILGYVFENRLVEFSDYTDKILFLKKHHIALWDVIKNAERKGSLDKNIKIEKYNDLYSFIQQNKIEKVFVNGLKAELALKKYLKINGLNIKYTLLTSSSSANTKYKLKEKVTMWLECIFDN